MRQLKKLLPNVGRLATLLLQPTFFLTILLFAACSKEEINTNVSATLETNRQYEVLSPTMLRLEGSITFLEKGAFTQHGHVWSATNENPVLTDDLTDLGKVNASGNFTSEIKNLEYGKLYYIRSYAKVGDNVIYGPVVEATTAWRPMAKFGGGTRRDGLVWVIDGMIYVGLGSSSVVQWANRTDLWVFNPTTNLWSEQSSFPGEAREDPYSFVINGKGYVGGGSSEGFRPLTDFWEYDPALNKWSSKKNLDRVRKQTASTPLSMSIGGKGYVFLEDSIYQYEPITDLWTTLGTSINRTFATGFTLHNQAFIVTGVDYKNYNTFFESLVAIDVNTHTFSQRADFPGGPLVEAVCFVLGEKAFVGSGAANAQNFSRCTGKFWEYDLTTDKWTPVPTMPYIRQGGFAAAAGNRAFVGMGGANQQSMTYIDYLDWWEYLPK